MREGLKLFLCGLLCLAFLTWPASQFASAQIGGGNASLPIPVAPTQTMVGPVTATALTVPNGATYAVALVEGAAIRYLDDGNTPTASVGAAVAIGQSQPLASLRTVLIIQQSATATVTIRYYRYP